MSAMLSKSGCWAGCCSHCARGTHRATRPQKIRRRTARARESRAVRRDITDQRDR